MRGQIKGNQGEKFSRKPFRWLQNIEAAKLNSSVKDLCPLYSPLFPSISCIGPGGHDAYSEVSDNLTSFSGPAIFAPS